MDVNHLFGAQRKHAADARDAALRESVGNLSGKVKPSGYQDWLPMELASR
jgi:hypothetical protein